MKKKLTLAMILALAALLLVSCAKGPEPAVPVEEIAKTILETEEQFGMMGDPGSEQVAEATGLGLDMLEEYSFNEAMMNVHAHLLYVAKVKDEKDMDAVKEAFQKRLTLMQETFSTYLPAQYEMALAGQVVSNGKYVLMVSCTDSQKAVDQFNEALKA